MIKGLLSKDELYNSESESSDEEENMQQKHVSAIDSITIADEVASINEEWTKPKQFKKDLRVHKQAATLSSYPQSANSTLADNLGERPNKFLKLAFDGNQLVSEVEKLESQIKKAIRTGDVETADRLNDELIEKDRFLQCTRTEEAKKFEAKRKKQMQEKIRRKRKKLKWTFEAKQRWETKSNM